MIASKAKSALFFSAYINQNILNFPVMSNSPCLGRFSVGETNVI